MAKIFKRLLTFFSFIDGKNEKCFYEFYCLNEARYGNKEEWTDRDYMMNGSYFVQYAIRFGTPGKLLPNRSDIASNVSSR